jgi:hypothetical protein
VEQIGIATTWNREPELTPTQGCACSGCMQKIITVRPTVPKAELIRVSGGNISRWVNGLIETALGEQARGWGEFLDKPRRQRKPMADVVRRY